MKKALLAAAKSGNSESIQALLSSEKPSKKMLDAALIEAAKVSDQTLSGNLIKAITSCKGYKPSAEVKAEALVAAIDQIAQSENPTPPKTLAAAKLFQNSNDILVALQATMISDIKNSKNRTESDSSKIMVRTNILQSYYRGEDKCLSKEFMMALRENSDIAIQKGDKNLVDGVYKTIDCLQNKIHRVDHPDDLDKAVSKPLLAEYLELDSMIQSSIEAKQIKNLGYSKHIGKKTASTYLRQTYKKNADFDTPLAANKAMAELANKASANKYDARKAGEAFSAKEAANAAASMIEGFAKQQNKKHARTARSSPTRTSTKNNNQRHER